MTEAPPTPTGDSPRPAEDESASLIGLLIRVVETTAVYLAAKLRLAQAELSRDLRQVAVAAAFVGVAAILALLGLGFAAAALAVPLARWTGSMTAALAIVGGLCLALAAGLVLAVRSRLKNWSGLLPASRADLERDLEWLKTLE